MPTVKPTIRAMRNSKKFKLFFFIKNECADKISWKKQKQYRPKTKNRRYTTPIGDCLGN
jgi:hypothetical protein